MYSTLSTDPTPKCLYWHTDDLVDAVSMCGGTEGDHADPDNEDWALKMVPNTHTDLDAVLNDERICGACRDAVCDHHNLPTSRLP